MDATASGRTNLYVVDSPLQLLNAIEAKFKHSSSESSNLLIVRYQRALLVQQQLDKCLELSSWDKVIKVVPFYYEFTSWIKLFFLVRGFKSKLIVEKLYVGSFFYRSFHLFQSNLNPAKSYLLDDGNNTISVYEKLKKGFQYSEFNDQYLNRTARSVLCKLLGLKKPERLKYSFFTNFDLTTTPAIDIQKNEYQFLKTQIKDFTVTDDVFFLGGPLTENGVIDEIDYINNLDVICNYFSSTLNRKVTYIVHRRETDRKLRKLATHGFTVRSLCYPVELDFLFRKEIPAVVCSFYSSALITLQSIYKSMNIVSFKLPDNQFLRQEKYQEINTIYEYYGKYIEMMDLNDLL